MNSINQMLIDTIEITQHHFIYKLKPDSIDIETQQLILHIAVYHTKTHILQT